VFIALGLEFFAVLLGGHRNLMKKNRDMHSEHIAWSREQRKQQQRTGEQEQQINAERGAVC
jgi:hypothetical protein